MKDETLGDAASYIQNSLAHLTHLCPVTLLLTCAACHASTPTSSVG